MVKKKKKISTTKKKSKKIKKLPILLVAFLSIIGLTVVCSVFISSLIYHFEKQYQNKVYPGVKIDHTDFGGKTKEEVRNYFLEKSKPFEKLRFTLHFEDKIASMSGTELKISYDDELSSVQAYSIGRSGNIFSDIYQKWRAATIGINLTGVLKTDHELIDQTLDFLAKSIDVEPKDALFQFNQGKVNTFKPSSPGKKLNQQKTKEIIYLSIKKLIKDELDSYEVDIELPVEEVLPKITTENSNDLGIKELIGVGTSKFVGSIAGRIHNIALAASRIHGNLVRPGETFSFNDTLGDVSAATGYQQAYIIKDGRTVLGDGGGVCQVSTTLFRAALSSGLPIVERHAHSYRVSYYEQNSLPGIDATVFSPSYDLKFTNNTPKYILIQSKFNKNNYTLSFEIYGTSDERKVEMTKPVILSQIPPPPDLYQDDPTLPKGVVKQVDWRSAGAKVTFDYKVIKGDEVIFEKTFFSNFQPWQAVFLRGTKE